MAAQSYIKSHKAGWKNAKHADQWESTLSAYAFPLVGNLPVSEVDITLVLKILEPIWTTKTETAARVRGRMESVLDWATARGYRNGENPARWKGHLAKLLPAKAKVAKVQHQPAMRYVDVPEFMAELRDAEDISARALEFTVLTAVRTGEAIGARWSEFDLDDEKVWTIPGLRTKSGRPHRVPLAGRALKLLRRLPCEYGSGFVFPGVSVGQPLSNMSMLEKLRGLRSGLTVHGFRSSFRD